MLLGIAEGEILPRQAINGIITKLKLRELKRNPSQRDEINSLPLYNKGNITFERRFSSINNYKYTFKYNRKKLYNIIDKYN